jgi:hypothetical protein
MHQTALMQEQTTMLVTRLLQSLELVVCTMNFSQRWARVERYDASRARAACYYSALRAAAVLRCASLLTVVLSAVHYGALVFSARALSRAAVMFYQYSVCIGTQ